MTYDDLSTTYDDAATSYEGVGAAVLPSGGAAGGGGLVQQFAPFTPGYSRIDREESEPEVERVERRTDKRRDIALGVALLLVGEAL